MIGVILKALVEKEVAHTGLQDLRVVGFMIALKAEMKLTPVGLVAILENGNELSLISTPTESP